MSYDKQSFLAGISVGTQLKGWASFRAAGGDPNVASHTYPKVARLYSSSLLIPVYSFVRPSMTAAILLTESQLIPVESYEGGE